MSQHIKMATRYHLLFPFLLEPDLNNPQYNRTYIYTSAKLLTILKDVQRTFSTWAISSRKTPEILRLRIPHPRILSFPSRNWQGPRTMCLPLRDPVIRHLPQLRLLDHLASTINSRFPPPATGYKCPFSFVYLVFFFFFFFFFFFSRRTV